MMVMLFGIEWGVLIDKVLVVCDYVIFLLLLSRVMVVIGKLRSLVVVLSDLMDMVVFGVFIMVV